MECPACGTESSGRYCPECGTALGGARCEACDAELPAGAKFCTACGERIRGAGTGPVASTALAIAAALVVIIFVIPALRPPASAPEPAPATATAAPASTPPAGGTPATGGAPPPLTGTPREQADRLFNRVMETFAAGDSAGARFFLPMAITAYGMAEPLDADGLFHLSLLQNAAGQPAEALATAQRILAQTPDHLLALAAAAQAARAAGDEETARNAYTRLLDRYEAETALERPEYQEHAPTLPVFRDEAVNFLRR